MATQRVGCPFMLGDGRPCGGPLDLEFDPEDRSVGIMGPTITYVWGTCTHAALANAEVDAREWDQPVGTMEEALYTALEKAWAEAEDRYFPVEDDDVDPIREATDALKEERRHGDPR